MTDWSRTTVALDGTHHVLDGLPLYAARFREVLTYHAPGLAPVRGDESAWHIDVEGRAAYGARFVRTFGFYEDRAAVEATDGWHHVLPDGASLGPDRFEWCGNYQDGRCVVRDVVGSYLHLDLAGRPAYEARHIYAGDFRGGIAVVRRRADGLCGHVDQGGREIHDGRFLDLDVFHKGFARARDEQGWFHVDRRGRTAYDARFENVEPFYNGFALAWKASGARVLIDESGTARRGIASEPAARETGPRVKVLVLGNVGAGKSTIARILASQLGWRTASIDGCRRALGDGTPAGELRAWAAFVEAARRPGPALLECTGAGPHVPLLRLALRDSGDRFGVLWIRTDAAVCRMRAAARASPPPYPDFGVPVEDVVADLEGTIVRMMAPGGTWNTALIGEIDGTSTADVAVARARISSRRGGGRDAVRHLTQLADDVRRWAEREDAVRALLWYGTLALGRPGPYSDVDAALIHRGDAAAVVASLKARLGPRVREVAVVASRGEAALWIDDALTKIDLRLAVAPDGLHSMATSPDTPAPRFVVVLDKDGVCGPLAEAAAVRHVRDIAALVDEEIEKFLLSFEAASNAHRRCDGYRFYFEHNLALHRLARLVEIARGGGVYLFLPRMLLSTRMTPGEQEAFRSLHGELYLPEAAALKRRLAETFVATVEELASRFVVRRDPVAIRRFLDAVLERDLLSNVSRCPDTQT